MTVNGVVIISQNNQVNKIVYTFLEYKLVTSKNAS